MTTEGVLLGGKFQKITECDGKHFWENSRYYLLRLVSELHYSITRGNGKLRLSRFLHRFHFSAKKHETFAAEVET